MILASSTMKTNIKAQPSYITKDGSLIRELIHPNIHGNSNQSLAEARIPIGHSTALHCHHYTEELYHIIAGQGQMTLGTETFTVTLGDTVLITPDTPHSIQNIGNVELVILCCCAPAYSHADTTLL